MAADEQLQTGWFGQALDYLGANAIGYSIWSWRTKVPSAETTQSLYRADGSPRPALAVIERLTRQQ
jgi:hypothetical protein